MLRSKENKKILSNISALGGTILLVDSFVKWYESIFGVEPFNSFIIGCLLIFFSLTFFN